MQNHENKVKITLKYDDGRKKVTLYVDADEMEICLENDYRHRLSVASPEDRDSVKKYTAAEFVDRLNKDERNNYQKLNRHIAGYVKNVYTDDNDSALTNPIYLIADNSAMEELEEMAELDAMHQKLYSNLPKAQADLLWEVAINQTTVEEIAKREGVSRQAIYLRLKTAKKNAQKFFQNP